MPQNITSRQIEILYELLNIDEEDKYITNNELSEKLGVSKRTTRRELKILEKYFENRDNIKLIKKRGKGSKLIVSQKEKLQLIELYQKRQKKMNYLEPEKRKLKLISFLLENNENNKFYSLEKKLNISSSTLNRDLKEAEKYLNKYNLKIKNYDNDSKKITGNEFNIRLLTVNVILEIISEKNQQKLLYKLKHNKILKNRDFSILKELNLLNKLEKLYSKLIDFQKITGQYFSTDSLLFILIYLACSIERSSRNINIENIDNLFIMKDQLDLPKNYQKLCSELFNLYPGLENKNEKISFFILFLALTNLNSDYKHSTFLNKKIKKIIKITSKQIVNNFKQKLSKNIDLDNHSLHKYLENFIINIVLIYKFNLNIETLSIQKHELKKIMGNNPYTFYIAESFQKMLEENLDIKIKENDLHYLGIILLKFIESKVQQFNALIIYDNNYILNKLIKNRIEKSFSTINFTSKNYFAVEKSELQNYDFIISTKFFAEFKNAIVISPIMNMADQNKIEEKIKVIRDLKRFIE